ncbi:MAG: TAXI family TRAP transporter solute-binding subunit [Rubrivivax sp.]
MHHHPTRRHIVATAAAALVGGGALFAPFAAQAEQFINILTGGTSGVYYPLGVALGKIYADKIPGVRTQVQSTKASVENLNLLQTGRGEIALALGDSVKSAWEGEEEVGFPKKLDKLRGVAAVYPNVIQIVASQGSGVKTFADLKGKSLSVGAPKSGTEVNARRIFEAMGLSYKDLGKTEYLPFGESVELIKNRQLDATLQSAGLGVASIRDLASSVPITIVAVPAEVATKLGPPFVATTIPANTYQGQTADVPTLAVVNFLVTHAGVPDEVVYQMTKQLFENLDTMVAAHKAATAIKLESAQTGMPLPLHPGAARYYREKGLLK